MTAGPPSGPAAEGADPPTSGSAGRGAVAALLEGAVLLGAELEPRFRVLGLTIEPVGVAPETRAVTAPVDDPRRLVVAHPVSTLLVSLTEPAPGSREGPEGHAGPARKVTVRTFALEALPDVVAALDGPRLAGPFLGLPEPRPGAVAPRWSLEGRSSAADGTSETLTVDATSADGVRLVLFARCDVVEVRSPDGRPTASTDGPGAAGGSA